VVQAVERAKHVTMAELNAIILALILVFVLSFLVFLFLNFVPSKGQKIIIDDHKVKLSSLLSISHEI
jgi:hypothetical protein